MSATRVFSKIVQLIDVSAASPGADKLLYFTSASAIAMSSFSSFGRSLVDDATATDARNTLGLGTAATADSTSFAPAASRGFVTVKLATAANTTPSGAQTVDGTAVTTGDYVLVKNNSDATLLGVYIANTLKCRPPGNRNPEPHELQTCTPYLMRQLALVQPGIVLAMGRFAVQSLLGTSEPIGKLRGRVHQVQGVPVVVTYHPAYLLRNPADKAKAWADLCLALQHAPQP